MDNEHNATINPEGKVPKRRFINPLEPSSGKWLKEHVDRFGMVGDLQDWERQRVEAHLKMTPPYSATELEALGMENMPNSSRGDLSARISSEESKWTDLITSHNGLWEVDHYFVPPEFSAEFNSEVSTILNTCWNEDPAHVFTGQLIFRQLSCYGIGPALWPDPYDPSPVARIASDFTFPHGTRIDLSNFSECALRDKINAQELYRAVEDTKLIKDSGWNETQVMKVLKSHATKDTAQCFDGLEQFELSQRQGINPWSGYMTMDIPVINVWINEFEEDKDGKCITHIVLARTQDDWVIIRERPHAYELPNEFMVLATARVGSDGIISGLRGIGVELRARCETNDVLHNAAAYGAYLSSIPMYKMANQAVADRAEQITPRANGIMLPDGYEQVEATLNISHALGFIAGNDNNMDEAQGRYALNSPNKGGVQRTAEEARQDAMKEGDVKSSQVAPLTATFFVPLGKNFLRRILDFPRDKKGKPLKYKGWRTIERFDELMAATTIPQLMQSISVDAIAFMKMCRVSFNSSNTPGGLDKKLLRSNEMLGMMPFLTSQQQRDKVVNAKMVALNGYRGAQQFMNKSEAGIQSLPFQERISSEDAIMKAGQAVPVFEFQDHMRHLGPLDPAGFGHVATLLSEIARVQKNQGEMFITDPLDELGKDILALLVLKEHIDMHLAMASHNPALIQADAIQAYFNLIAEAEGALQKMAAAFQKEMEARQAQEGGAKQDPKAAAILALTQAKIAAMQATTQSQLQLSEVKHNVKLAQQQELAGIRSQTKTAQSYMDMAVGAEKQKAEAIKEQTANYLAQQRVKEIESAKEKKDVD